MNLILLLPWILTVVALFAIMVLKNRNQHKTDGLDMNDEEHEIVRVAVHMDTAYWVYDNVLYHAEVTPEPDFSTARPLDTMTLTDKEMIQIFEILDELQTNDKE